MFGDDDLFDFVPDLDCDGDNDFVDYMIMEEIEREIEGETEDDDRSSFTSADDDWREEVEDGTDYFLDPEDYDSEDEYLEALEDAKNAFKEDAEDEDEFDFDPDDFTSEIATETDKASFSGGEKSEGCSNVQHRKNHAKILLRDAEKGEFYGSNEELDRCRFIALDKSIAARYLTVDGIYLYAQAVKDHFEMPFDVLDEKDEIKTHFEILLRDLVEDNAVYAIEIWEWCIDTFMPYIQYADYKNDLTHDVLLYMDSFIDEFPGYVVDHMVKNPTFVEKLILQCTDSLWCVDQFVVLALKGGFVETAKKIIECAFANASTDIQAKSRFIKSCIDECSNWEELETMELFQEHIFPIVFAESDVRIKNKIARWQKSMREYIESIERNSDKYAYSRVYAWRAKYRDAEVDPTRYESEERYIKAVGERKYGWRKYCSNRFGINPDDFETRAEYDEAISIEYAKEREAYERERATDLRNTEIYKFCKVSVNYPDKPYYYYLIGDLTLKVGDRVIVPFGRNDTKTEAVVVSVGECYGSAFPCHTSKIKTVIEKSV